MEFEKLSLQDLVLFKPPYYTDNRGAFHRSFCLKYIKENFAPSFDVKQGNVSINPIKYTLRGLHLQLPPSEESKLLNCMSGVIFITVIDLRPHSSTFLQKEQLYLESGNGQSLFIPSHCAIGWLTMDTNTILHYYMGDFYFPESSFSVRYNDPFFDIHWPEYPRIISQKDNSCIDFDLDMYMSNYISK